jgi:ATP-dependent helicase/nuclease subunit A
MRAHFEQAHRRASLEFVATEFKHSFRSGPNVLGAVDTVFARAEVFAGLTADAVAPVHEALPDKAPGLVEIWPLEQSDEIEKKEGWAAPFDVQTVTSGTAKLARRIAGAVAAWRRQGYRPKDVLILLRRRSAQFEAIIRALKKENIPVAGADRLVLTEHIAVMDLMVLGDAILLPEDDLALATALKSPLFGLDDEALFQLAWNRKGNLYGALKTKQSEFAAQFDAVRAAARTMTPFAFYAWLLGAEKGRQKLLARLGHEANDALDEFLNLALDYERTEAPSLQGFLAWLRAAKAEVKRDMEMDRDEVRVMTVHGAKGLEAPIVILADTTTPPQGWHPPRLLAMPPDRAVPGAADRLIWAGPKDHDTGPMAAAREAALREARDEYRRLLYVAMTRAAERLVVCGTQGKNKIPDGCWYQLVEDALRDKSISEPADSGSGEVLRYRKQTIVPAEVQKNIVPAAIQPISIPPWLRSNVSSASSDVRIVRPSSAADNDAGGPASAGRIAALLRGSLVHRLMQSLPEIPAAKRRKAASDYLARAGDELPAEVHAELTEQVMLVIEHPRFYELYEPGSRAEVPIIGRLQIGGKSVRVSGQIDRLAVTQGSVLIADFKTGKRNDPAPPGYVEQLALYRAVLQKLYPDKSVGAALVWTEVPDLMELSAEVLDAALARVTSA